MRQFISHDRITRRRGQAYVEFAMVLLIIITLLGGGLLVIRALFLEESLHDIASRAAQWGASTNNYDQVIQIIREASSFAQDIQVTLTTCPPVSGACVSNNFTINSQVLLNPSDKVQRPIGALFTVSLRANVPLVGPGVAFLAPLGAEASALIEHSPMSFSSPLPTNSPIRIGDVVLVNTTAGDWLYVRKTPGTDGTRTGMLYKNDKAIIIGGPALLNGLRWWQIVRINYRTPLTGWCVDQADQVITLVPLRTFF